jgi:hypothetical protein
MQETGNGACVHDVECLDIHVEDLLHRLLHCDVLEPFAQSDRNSFRKLPKQVVQLSARGRLCAGFTKVTFIRPDRGLLRSFEASATIMRVSLIP